MRSSEVVVVGSGPSGLVAACGLLEAGLGVRILDRASGPSTTSRALGLQPRGVEVLDRLGALGDLPERSLPINEVIISVDGREITRLDVSRPTRLVTRPGLMMSQAVIEAELRARVQQLGGTIEWGREVTAAAADHDGVSLRCSDGESVRAEWVVGCDGAHSRVRSLAGIDFPGVPLGEQFMLADVHADLPLSRTAVTTCLRGDEMFAVFPLPGDRLWRFLAPLPTVGDESERPAAALIVERLSQLLERHTGHPASEVQDAAWASTFHIHRRLATTYRRGRFLLAGDAAHVHSPFGGQGMNTGMGDAENLAWKLALVVRGRADDRLLDTYEAERRPIASEVLSSTSSVTRLMLGMTPAARILRDSVVVPLLKRPLVQRRIREQASQLKVSYRRGPLGASAAAYVSRRLQRGDRVPDLACRRLDGSSTRLHAELRGRWAMIGPEPRELELVQSRLGRERVVALVPGPDSPDESLLVRPDGHLAAKGADVGHWLDAALGWPRGAGDPVLDPSLAA